jgi:hypothetical protein
MLFQDLTIALGNLLRTRLVHSENGAAIHLKCNDSYAELFTRKDALTVTKSIEINVKGDALLLAKVGSSIAVVGFVQKPICLQFEAHPSASSSWTVLDKAMVTLSSRLLPFWAKTAAAAKVTARISDSARNGIVKSSGVRKLY